MIELCKGDMDVIWQNLALAKKLRKSGKRKAKSKTPCQTLSKSRPYKPKERGKIVKLWYNGSYGFTVPKSIVVENNWAGQRFLVSYRDEKIIYTVYKPLEPNSLHDPEEIAQKYLEGYSERDLTIAAGISHSMLYDLLSRTGVRRRGGGCRGIVRINCNKMRERECSTYKIIVPKQIVRQMSWECGMKFSIKVEGDKLIFKPLEGYNAL